MNTLFQQNATGEFTPVATDVLLRTASQLAEQQLKDRGPELPTLTALKPLVKAFLADKDHELLCVAYLDVRSRLIEFKVINEGSQLSVATNGREILRHAINNSAMSLIMIHNHPGGVANPSDGDLEAAASVAEAFNYFDVDLRDSWVVCADKIYSFNEHRSELQYRVDKILRAKREQQNDNPFALLFKALGGDR